MEASSTTTDVTATDSADQSPEQTARDQHVQELDRLKNDGIISQPEYDAAVVRLDAGAESPDEAVKQAQSDLGAAQGGQAVPEQRPQAFQSTELRSDSEQRARESDPGVMGLEERERAHSEQAMKEAADNSRMPNLPEGQRVVIQGDHSEAGRMAYVLGIHYTDGIQDMIARSPSPESRFAEVDHYVLRTRDGRSDLLTATPEQVKPIEENQGWGRGQI